jgi:hypothetical protein
MVHRAVQVGRLSVGWHLAVLIVLSILPSSTLRAQQRNPSGVAQCGKVKVEFSNPSYLTTSAGIVVAEAPVGWVLDQTKHNPFYFLRQGENYETARILMYINVEKLDVPLGRAVEKDAQSFRSTCNASEIKDLARIELLEQGCKSKTELFLCRRKENPYVDLVTKISIGGLLLNVVLSADNASQISQNRTAYEFLLKHLTLMN